MQCLPPENDKAMPAPQRLPPPQTPTADVKPDCTPLIKALNAGSIPTHHPDEGPSPFTFSFRVGKLDRAHCELMTTGPLSLAGTTLNFRCGALHDAIYLDGIRHGGRCGTLTEAKQLSPDAKISRVTFGISNYSMDTDWGGGINGAFTDLFVVQDAAVKGAHAERVEASAELLDGLSYTYEREKLGLDLSITGVSTLRASTTGKGCVGAYTLTLTGADGLIFNPDEWERFWDFVMALRYVDAHAALGSKKAHPELPWRLRDGYKPKPGAAPIGNRALLPDAKEMAAFANAHRMRDESAYFCATFGGDDLAPPSVEVTQHWYNPDGMLSTATFGGLSVSFLREPASVPGEGARHLYPLLFANALQQSHRAFDNAGILGRVRRGADGHVTSAMAEEIRVVAVSTALRDDDLLYEMALGTRTDRLFEGSQSQCLVQFLTKAGLHRLAVSELHGLEQWDVYQVTAGLHGESFYKAAGLAVLCACTQMTAPVLLLAQSFAGGSVEERLEAEAEAAEGGFVYVLATTSLPVLRILFALYGAAYEYRMLNDNSDSVKLTCFLAALPGYSTCILLLGFLMNLLARVLVAVGMVMIIGESDNASDIVLNALALFFIVQLDNDLALSSFRTELLRAQQEASAKLRTSTVRTYMDVDADVPHIVGGPLLPTAATRSAKGHARGAHDMHLYEACLSSLEQPKPAELCNVSELLGKRDPLATYPHRTMRLIVDLPKAVTYLNMAVLLAGSIYYAVGAPRPWEES